MLDGAMQLSHTKAKVQDPEYAPSQTMAERLLAQDLRQARHLASGDKEPVPGRQHLQFGKNNLQHMHGHITSSMSVPVQLRGDISSASHTTAARMGPACRVRCTQPPRRDRLWS